MSTRRQRRVKGWWRDRVLLREGCKDYALLRYEVEARRDAMLSLPALECRGALVVSKRWNRETVLAPNFPLPLSSALTSRPLVSLYITAHAIHTKAIGVSDYDIRTGSVLVANVILGLESIDSTIYLAAEHSFGKAWDLLQRHRPQHTHADCMCLRLQTPRFGT